MNDDEFLVYKVNDFKPLEKKEKISFKKGEKVVNMEEYKNIKNGNRNKVKRDNYCYPPIMSSHSGSINNTYYPKGLLDKVFPNKSPFKTNYEEKIDNQTYITLLGVGIFYLIFMAVINTVLPYKIAFMCNIATIIVGFILAVVF